MNEFMMTLKYQRNRATGIYFFRCYSKFKCKLVRFKTMKAFIFKMNLFNMNKILNRKSVYIKELNNIKFDHLALWWSEFH